MIGKPEWFARRKYGGWGIFPKTWQGWTYVALMLLPFAIVQLSPIDMKTKTTIFIVWIAIAIIDAIDIMARLKKDEMEKKIEAFAERNAAWAMIAMAAFTVAFQAAKTRATGISQVDPFIIAILAAGVIAKAITNIYLERKGV